MTSIEGSRFTVDFEELGVTAEAVKERVGEVVPLLRALLVADAKLLNLSDEEYAERGRGFMALDMMCQAAIQSATERANALERVVLGEESIADHGFPEFADGKSIDI